MKKILLSLFKIILFSLSAFTQVTVQYLFTENRSNPIGIDADNPGSADNCQVISEA
jgi:hypothetical protein